MILKNFKENIYYWRFFIIFKYFIGLSKIGWSRNIYSVINHAWVLAFTWNAGEQCRKFLVWDVDFLLFHFFTWEAACKNGKGNRKICKQSIWHLVWYSYYIMLNSMVVREGKKKPWSAFIISYRYPKRWKIFFFKFLCVIWWCWAVYCGLVVIRSFECGD